MLVEKTAIMPTSHLFEFPIQNVNKMDAVQQIVTHLQNETTQPIFFINAHCVNAAFSDEQYRRILQNNHLNYADGVGMQIASRLLKAPLVDNVNGTDLFPLLCQTLNSLPSPPRIFLLGGEPGIAERLKSKMLEQYPRVRICGNHHGHFSDDENDTIALAIRESNADLLLVAMGVPKQEKWIAQYITHCGVKAAMGVGGLFNFYSGHIPRAPKWMQQIGLEWVHRLWQEPTRLGKRYLLGNVVFLCRTAWLAIHKKREVR